MNVLLSTDVYKTSHMMLYNPEMTHIYSYMVSRSDAKYDKMVFFGLQYYLYNYLSEAPTQKDAEEFFEIYAQILGPVPDIIRDNINALVKLGYWPIKIKALDEGTVIKSKNAVLTMTNTVPGFHWCVGFLESLLLKLWNPISVASLSLKYKLLCEKYAEITGGDKGFVPFQVHDFGYRGCSSEETAAISGAAHLINFLGTDTVPAVKFIRDYYNGDAPNEQPIGLSVTASEHSVQCSYGEAGEFKSFERFLDTTEGIISIVSDTYDYFRVLTEYLPKLKAKILTRNGKAVIRPDSGCPEKIILGNPEGQTEAERKGSLQLLWELFGGTVNDKGFKVLDPHIGLIYGDAIYYERLERIFEGMKAQGFASTNLVVGVGGLLLQQHNRDDLGFAFKAVQGQINGSPVPLIKSPKTDSKKKSHSGLIRVDAKKGVTYDNQTEKEEEQGDLSLVFKDGIVHKHFRFSHVRHNYKVSLERF